MTTHVVQLQSWTIPLSKYSPYFVIYAFTSHSLTHCTQTQEYIAHTDCLKSHAQLNYVPTEDSSL